MKIRKLKLNIPFYLKNSNIFMPLLIAVLLLLATAGLTAYLDPVSGIISVLLILFVVLLFLLVLTLIDNNVQKRIKNITATIQSVENDILLQIPLGIILFNEDDTVRWTNPYMQQYLKQNENPDDSSKEDLNDKISSIYCQFKANEEGEERRIKLGNRYFDIGVLEDQCALYFLDVTEYGEILQQATGNLIVVGYIIIDNYDETMTSYTDRNRLTVDNFVTKQLATWSKKYNSFVKRIDDDRFLLITTYSALIKMEEDKFTIIDNIREATSQANFPLTISMGIASQIEEDSTSIEAVSELAQSNLELALSRGGDQVVIRSKETKARYYGGKTNPMEKRTHVRARQIGTTIARMMKENDSLFVMGHDYPDMDAIGACVGLRRIAEMNNQKCYIVINETRINEDIRKLLVELRKNDTIKESIISPERANELIHANSLLFIVDCHRPSITTAPELIEQVNGTVVIDHHRKGEEFPKNVLLEYIEPYASSTCELVTEFFEYQGPDSAPINRIEATTMLAGIIVDSRNFSLRTGSRTFDAASYLKSCGADSIMIQEFLKENLSDYIARSRLIENVEFIEPNVGIASGEDDVSYSQVIAAQAADSLLSMNHIAASYVVFLRQDGRVGISARSMGNVNVQRIMEQLGGGGHLSNAATQLSDVTVSEATEKLKEVLKLEREES